MSVGGKSKTGPAALQCCAACSHSKQRLLNKAGGTYAAKSSSDDTDLRVQRLVLVQSNPSIKSIYQWSTTVTVR